jgi:hypothetical protein
MNVSLIPFVAGWIALACGIAGLAIYRRLVAAREDDMLHVLDNESHVAKQAAMAQRLDTLDHWGKVLTVIVTVYGVLLAAAYTYRIWIEGTRTMWR